MTRASDDERLIRGIGQQGMVAEQSRLQDATRRNRDNFRKPVSLKEDEEISCEMIVTRAECSQAQLMKDRRKPVTW